ncbi:MAG: SPOR domain-containing protein [Bacteroidetes bacterium]|nr:SPOR domain-containing protein [Bacteroidota bacterium]
MNLKELQKKVAEVLGVSNSQSELAFEVLSERIYESLYEGITLKVPRIGFFQLKTSDTKNGPNRPVIFTPLSVDFTHDSHNLYLTFEVHPKFKDIREPDSNVFSIGVGKPLLPLTIDDLPNSETSFTVLKKSIEERARELISESDQIPNFNIFEDYYKFSHPALQGEETQSTLSDLTSDIVFSQATEEPHDVSHEEEQNILSALIEGLPEISGSSENEKDEMPKVEFDSLPDKSEKVQEMISEQIEENLAEENLDSEGKSSETLLAELLSDHSAEIPKQNEIETPGMKDEHIEEILDTIDVSAFLNQQEPTIEHIPEEEFIEEHYADEQKEDVVQEEKVREPENEATEEFDEDLEPIEELLDSEKPTEEKIEWNWGDELREEFGLGHLESEEANYEMIDDGKAKHEPELETDKETIRDLFAQLEKTLEHDRAFLDDDFHEEPKRTLETEVPLKKHVSKEDDKVFMEFPSSPSKYEFVPVKTSEEERRSRMAISLAEEPGDYFERRSSHADERSERPVSKIRERDVTGSKMYLLYLSIFAVVAIAVYLVMRNSSQSTDLSLKPAPQNVAQAKIDSIKAAIENAPDSSKYLLDEPSDFPISATPPVPVKSSQGSKKMPSDFSASNSKNLSASSKQPVETKNNLYRTPKTDTRITNSIYYDGKNYNFQASSWRVKATAEQEVQRLRSLNFNAYLVEAYLPQKGGTWYRVRIGPFNSENATRQFMRENNFK